MGIGVQELVSRKFKEIFNTNPSITFWKIVFHRYTHFSRESIIEIFEQEPIWDMTISCNLTKFGDLMHRMYVNITLPSYSILLNDTQLLTYYSNEFTSYYDENSLINYLYNLIFYLKDPISNGINQTIFQNWLNDNNTILLKYNLTYNPSTNSTSTITNTAYSTITYMIDYIISIDGSVRINNTMTDLLNINDLYITNLNQTHNILVYTYSNFETIIISQIKVGQTLIEQYLNQIISTINQPTNSSITFSVYLYEVINSINNLSSLLSKSNSITDIEFYIFSFTNNLISISNIKFNELNNQVYTLYLIIYIIINITNNLFSETNITLIQTIIQAISSQSLQFILLINNSTEQNIDIQQITSVLNTIQSQYKSLLNNSSPSNVSSITISNTLSSDILIVASNIIFYVNNLLNTITNLTYQKYIINLIITIISYDFLNSYLSTDLTNPPSFNNFSILLNSYLTNIKNMKDYDTFTSITSNSLIINDILEIYYPIQYSYINFIYNLFTYLSTTLDSNIKYNDISINNYITYFLNLFTPFSKFKLYLILDYININSSITYVSQNTNTIENNFGVKFANKVLLLKKIYNIKNNHPINKITESVSLIYKQPLLYHIITQYQLEIGGEIIDTYDNIYFRILSTLDGSNNFTSYKNFTGQNSNNDSSSSITLFIPLYFWFNRSKYPALPCSTLRYNDIRINIHIANLSYITTNYSLLSSILSDKIENSFSIQNISIYTEYIFLDTIERNKFFSNEMYILINQCQSATYTLNSSNMTYEIFLYGPCKELFWLISDNDDTQNVTINYPINNHTLYLGSEKITFSDSIYLSIVNMYKYHTSFTDNNIYLYSFSLYPEQYQPSGSCNLGIITYKQINIITDSNQILINKIYQSKINLYMYGTILNLLSIHNGFAKVLYIN